MINWDKVIDLPMSHRNKEQVCESCKKSNPYGDLYCDECYEKVERYHEKECERVRQEKIKNRR